MKFYNLLSVLFVLLFTSCSYPDEYFDTFYIDSWSHYSSEGYLQCSDGSYYNFQLDPWSRITIEDRLNNLYTRVNQDNGCIYHLDRNNDGTLSVVENDTCIYYQRQYEILVDVWISDVEKRSTDSIIEHFQGYYTIDVLQGYPYEHVECFMIYDAIWRKS